MAVEHDETIAVSLVMNNLLDTEASVEAAAGGGAAGATVKAAAGSVGSEQGYLALFSLFLFSLRPPFYVEGLSLTTCLRYQDSRLIC